MWLHSGNPLSGRYFVEEKLSGFGFHYTPSQNTKGAEELLPRPWFVLIVTLTQNN
jgi:hypothetical protein